MVESGPSSPIRPPKGVARVCHAPPTNATWLRSPFHKPQEPPIYALKEEIGPNARPWWRVRATRHHSGGASRVWTMPMESAMADLRRGVVGFTRRSDGGSRGDSGVTWVGNGWRFLWTPVIAFLLRRLWLAGGDKIQRREA